MTSTTLAAALTANSQTVSLSAGPLAVDSLIAVDSEYLAVTRVISTTQGYVQRGVNGSIAVAHDNGADAVIGSALEFLTGPATPPPFGMEDDALTGQGPSAAPAYGSGGGGSILHQATVTLTNADMLALTDPGTLVEIVAAPGSGYLLVFQHGSIVSNFVSAYVLPAGVNFAAIVYGEYDDDASTKFDAGNFFGNTGRLLSSLLPLSTAPATGSETDAYWGLSISAKTNQINKPLKFYAQSHNPFTWTGGNAANTLVVSVAYLLLNTTTGAFE